MDGETESVTEQLIHTIDVIDGKLERIELNQEHL